MTAFASLNASAYNEGEFVYTPSGRYQISSSDNILSKAASFSDMSLWTVKTADTSVGDFFDIQEDEDLSMRKLVSTNANATSGIYTSFQCEAGASYVVSFKMKGAATFTTRVADSDASECNYVNLLANENGDLTPTVSCGSPIIVSNADWTTYTFSYDDENGFKGVLAFYGLTVNAEITDIKVQVATKVFDKRLAEKSLNYANAIKNGANWDAVDPQITSDFAEMINIVNELPDETTPEEGIYNVEALDEFVVGVLANNTEEYFSTVGSGNTAADWYYWTNSWSVSSSAWLGSNGGWTFDGKRFGNRYADPVTGEVLKTEGRDIWSQMPGNFEYPISTASRNDKLAPGEYIMTINALGYRMSGKGSGTGNYTAFPQDGAMKIQLFYENDTTDAIDMQYNQYNTYVYAFKVPEEKDGELSHYGFLTFRDDASDGLGGNANYNTPRLYRISNGGPTLDQIAWYEKVQEQRNAFNNACKDANSYIGNKELPWLQDVLLDTIAKLQPYLEEVNAIEKQTIYDDSETKILADQIMNNGVRPMQYFNRDFLQKNLPFTDLKAAIADANKTYADPLYAAYDIKTYKTSIESVEAKFAEIVAKSTEVFSESDSLELRAQQQVLVDAKQTMLNSLEPVEIVNIAFDNLAEMDEDGINYVIKGTAGSIAIPVGNFTVRDESALANPAGGITSMYQYIVTGDNPVAALRVGKADATVTLADADMPTRGEEKADIVTISYDAYYGKLSGKNCWTNILDAEGTRIGGFNFRPYNADTSNGYDDFGLNHYTFCTVGNVGDGNLIVEKNRTHVEITLNYGNYTMSMKTSNTANKESAAVAMLSQNPVKSIVIGSNYDNVNRMGWLDNVVVSIVKNGAIVDGVKGVSEVNAVAAPAAVKYVKNGTVLIKTANGTVNAAGAQVK